MRNRTRVELAARVFETYGELIRAIIARNVEDQSIVDDIYQDVFLAIVCKPLPSGGNIEAYLYKVVTNDIIDGVRRTGNYRDRIRRYRQSGNHKTTLLQHEMSAIQFEEAQKVLDAMAEQLECYETRAVMRRCFYGEDTTEGARSMGIKKRTFSHYLCNGLAKIRTYFLQTEGDRDEYA